MVQAKAIVKRLLGFAKGDGMGRRGVAVRGWAGALVVVAVSVAVASGAPRQLSHQAVAIRAPELRDWLTYISSDELEGRAVFTTGFGLAAAYISDHLRAWGVRPAGDHGSYLQTVRVLGVKTTSHASVSVTVNGETRTFADGDGITLPKNMGCKQRVTIDGVEFGGDGITLTKNMGGKQRVTIDRVEFAGYGLDAPGAGHTDFHGKDVKGAAVIWLGANGPKNIDAAVFRRVLGGRNRYAAEQLGAAASIGPAAEARGGRGGGTA